MYEAMIRLRMSEKDAHYGGGLVNGSKLLDLFGDVATELLIEKFGDEGLFVAYEEAQFTAPVYAGDFIEAVGVITEQGNTSVKMSFEARKVISPRPDVSDSSADLLEEPVVVGTAKGVCIVPKDKQRK